MGKHAVSTKKKNTRVYAKGHTSKTTSAKDSNALERNRVAARKCRIARRESQAYLLDQSQEKLHLNEELKQKIRHLEIVAMEARVFLEMHVSCGLAMHQESLIAPFHKSCWRCANWLYSSARWWFRNIF
jgi:hypothetical protein